MQLFNFLRNKDDQFSGGDANNNSEQMRKNEQIIKTFQFYDDNEKFIDSLKKALVKLDLDGLQNITFVNLEGILKSGDQKQNYKGIEKTESVLREDQNKNVLVYAFSSIDHIRKQVPKIDLLLAKDNVRFLRSPFTAQDAVNTLRGEVSEMKGGEVNFQEIQDKEITQKVGTLLHKIHISSLDQFDTLSADEIKKIPSIMNEAKEYFPALQGKGDREIVKFLLMVRQNVPEVMKGQNIEGVFCDIEGTLFNGDELNENILNKLKDFESQGKVITLWTDGEVPVLQKLLDKNGINYPLKSKIDHAGALAEIVIDNDDQNTFSAKTKIFAKKFIKI